MEQDPAPAALAAEPTVEALPRSARIKRAAAERRGRGKGQDFEREM